MTIMLARQRRLDLPSDPTKPAIIANLADWRDEKRRAKTDAHRQHCQDMLDMWLDLLITTCAST